MKQNLLAITLCVASVAAFGQGQALMGQVLDANGKPVIGATVVEKGTNNGTATNNDGRFTLSARTASPRLVVSSIGFAVQEVSGGSGLRVQLAESSTSLSDVQVVGSRSQNRSVTDSPSPVDIIDLREVTTKTGQLDVNQLLQFVAPSFNSNRQTGSDGADHVDPASLRGLGPDQTLVLVNGKRQHQSALVNLFGSRGRGNTGTDLNVLPAASIERIEILRDGAAAQYGSDAIAGVINIVLKTSVKELTASANYGAYDAKYRRDSEKFDGGNFNANVNYGVGLGEKGSFINGTLDFNQRQHTQRAAVPVGPDGLARREYGDPKVSNLAAYVNSKFALSDKAHVYVFGGANKRRGDAYAWTRFADDDRNVPAIYPNGFDPIITSDIVDVSVVAGVRTKLGEWDLDVSNNFGSNRFEYGVKNSLNATLGASSPTSFDAGGFQLQQDVVSLGLTRNYKTVLQGLNLAAGAEFRREWYSLFAGERNSWDTFGVNPDATPGSQGFPGYQPKDEIKAQRDNFGAYADAELSVTTPWLVAAALRYEHYTDFGSTLNYKVSTRYNLTEFLTLRGTYSTGFRAPSLAQINFNSTFTNFINGQAVEVLLARNNNPITQKLGIPALRQETSNSANVGLTSRIGSSLSLTVDGYYIKVKDRVVLTSPFKARNPDPNDEDNTILDPVIGAELEAAGVGQAQFFANAADTRSLGLDVVLNHTATVGTGRLTSSVAANFNHLKIDRVKTSGRLTGREDDFFGPREQAFVKASAPPSKINLTLDYQVGRFSTLLRLVRFDKVKLIGYDDKPMNYAARVTTDLTLSYALTEHLQLSVGSTNLFNRYPTLFDPQVTETGGAWDPVQMGSNGRFYFAKLQARF
ncbi:iron complex outermembrane recepter protein [Hymenobacter daecheongensis DSM 21074]|uniref:Iron complex outermembrane recepter protein n=1 Tax=Hymenobacter daecheongensis DSM 21074 TaxID=1121955 RepID=A0A1M6KPT8_9BACT|nr:TonB-dependent receptor [Hymenobacter daecheongensis]SHJ61023.1 iron complex outermembrane recepter protein [Hymenobacter daecheongensis DSM 21074]